MKILKYNKRITITFLSSFISCLISAVILHILFFIVFLKIEIIPLVIFNLMSIIMYLYFAVYYARKNLILTSTFTLIEVFLHFVLCVYFIGWQGGFYVYPLTLIPVIYFITINVLKKDIFGHIIVITIVLSYQILRIYSKIRIAQFQERFLNLDNIFYNFNTFCGSIMFVFLVYSFLYEMRNIQSKLEETNKTLKNIANMDPLTNLSNRRHMNNKIKSQIIKTKEMNQEFCIGICDIDDFKKVNDTYGHDCGDLVLKSIANILKENAEAFKMEVCRWGGEEFLILFKNYNLYNSHQICKKILDDIRNHVITYNGKKINVTITLGLSEFNLKNDDINEVLKRADINLYKGKHSTKDCIVAS